MTIDKSKIQDLNHLNMENQFFSQPILNSPYDYPKRHWELDAKGQSTQQIIPSRRDAKFITPIPKSKKQSGVGEQQQIFYDFSETSSIGTTEQRYDPMSIINQIRSNVDEWRKFKNPTDWKVSPVTERLLTHWRHYDFHGVRPFFCQVEAVETVIWLTEVAPKFRQGEAFLRQLELANNDANPDLLRLALKLATGAGKTTVMAMIIAWQTLNEKRNDKSDKFSRGFLIVAPGLTIKDRLRVLQPNDPDSYYKGRELIPADMLIDIERAKIVITNYHAFKLRERLDVAKGTRLLLQGREGDALKTIETSGQMLQRVMPELMGLKNILVINDEAHHCYIASAP